MAIVEMDFASGGGSGGLVETPLWTNSNTFNAFTGTTITIDTVNGYDYVKFVFCKQTTSIPSEDIACIMSVDNWRKCDVAGGYAAVSPSVRGSSGPAHHRYMTYSSDTSVIISNSVSGSNGYCIPYKIYGIKED